MTPVMNKLRPARNNHPLSQILAESDDSSHPEFDLMSIRTSANPNVTQRNSHTLAVKAFLIDAIIDNCAVARRALQRLNQCIGRCQHIVNQSDLSEIRNLGKVKT